MKKQTKTSKENPNTANPSLNWKNRREMISKSTSMEVDLENREVFFHEGLKERLQFDFGTTNIDHLLETYLDGNDLQAVKQSLSLAKEGLEKPIPFNFTHPLTEKIFRFEYRYQIVYAKFSSTRLHGYLIKVRDKSPEINRGAGK
ncbi:hypothetical protein CNR22_15220 [Sphingobacteriaceae bacterium]|nr:hypothetical protein CNR22_15220 [Sphingobacteriaceae bacterium]